MPQQQPLIAWPAIIKYAGTAELAYVDSQAAWDTYAHLHGFRYEKNDVLIDSNGGIYAFSNILNCLVKPESTGQFVSLEDLIEMVKAHAAQTGACCVSKFSASSIQKAVCAIRDIN